MLRRYMPAFAVAAFSLLAAGCYSPPAPESQTYAATYAVIPPQAPDEHPVVIAPVAPPAPRVEVIPAPPYGEAAVVYWVPGHWQWSATADGHYGWAWIAGGYAQRPSRTVVWHSGYWQQSSAGFVWVDGYWQ